MMERDLGDLSPEEWEEAMIAAHEASAHVDDDTILVRSHLWPQDDGTCDFIVLVPGAEHRAQGSGVSMTACYEAIDELLADWYPDVTAETSMTVARIIPE